MKAIGLFSINGFQDIEISPETIHFISYNKLLLQAIWLLALITDMIMSF